MDIGFIGLGQMGFHMARRLVEAGHRVIVFDTRREAVDRLTALGAHAAAIPARHGRPGRDRDGEPAHARHRARGRDRTPTA